MRKLISLLTISTLLLINSGCGTTPQAKVTQAEGIVVTSVDKTMMGWSDYVNSHLTTVKQADIDKVKDAYNYYFNCQTMAKAALEKWVISKSPADQSASDKANLAMKDAESALLTLINQLMGGK